MKVSMCKTMRTYEWKNLSKDLLAGLVIMVNITVRQSRQSGVARFFRNYPY